jgi:hypothetical protein
LRTDGAAHISNIGKVSEKLDFGADKIGKVGFFCRRARSLIHGIETPNHYGTPLGCAEP